MPRPFLTAEWRHLAMVNYEIAPEVLRPLVPGGTELDAHDGRVFVSLVGFRFLDTRVLGWHAPLHVNFDEVNLRFYVRRTADREVRRAVAFVREIVPRRAIASVARLLYNEPYVALPMRSEIALDDAGLASTVRYEWRSDGTWHSLGLEAQGEAAVPAPDSHAAFIAEHYWGYTRQRDGGTVEYQVTHPSWRLRAASAVRVSDDMTRMYGDTFGRVLRGTPASAFIADGSAITVSRPRRLPAP